jgi:hypothetical protein
MDKMREKLEDLKELRDLVRSLGRWAASKGWLQGWQGLGSRRREAQGGQESEKFGARGPETEFRAYLGLLLQPSH